MLVQTQNEGKYLSDWLLYEEEDIGRYSRENLSLVANVSVKSGCPLKWTTSGKTAVTPITDGTATNGFAGLAVMDVAAQTVAQPIAAVVRNARVVFEKLGFDAGIDGGEFALTKALIVAGAPTIVFATGV